jgi:hypothetical protein
VRALSEQYCSDRAANYAKSLDTVCAEFEYSGSAFQKMPVKLRSLTERSVGKEATAKSGSTFIGGPPNRMSGSVNRVTLTARRSLAVFFL